MTTNIYFSSVYVAKRSVVIISIDRENGQDECHMCDLKMPLVSEYGYSKFSWIRKVKLELKDFSDFIP